jgi:hypothetical protein
MDGKSTIKMEIKWLPLWPKAVVMLDEKSKKSIEVSQYIPSGKLQTSGRKKAH